MLRRLVLAVITVAYLAVVAALTLGPQPLDATGTRFVVHLLRFFGNHDLTAWITYSRLEFLANVAMFVPLGILFVLVVGRRRWWLAFLFGVALTFAIEVSQRGIPGRVSDLRDVLANSIGTLLGVLVAVVVTVPVPTITRPVPLVR